MTVDFVSLLRPLSVDQLVCEHWDRSAVLISGSAAKLDPLQLDIDMFFRLCTGAPLSKRVARFGEPDQRERIPRGHERALHQAGAPIRLIDAHALHAPLAECARSAKQALGLAGAIHIDCELWPARARAHPRCEDRSLLIVQIDGSRPWRFADTQRLLEPGDLLYLPAGTPHAIESGPCALTVSISFLAPRLFDGFVELMTRQNETNLDWRRRFPALAEVTPAERQECVRTTIGERLSQLRAWVRTLDEDQIVAVWERA